MGFRRLAPLLPVLAATAGLVGCGEPAAVATPLDRGVAAAGKEGPTRVDLRTVNGRPYDRFYVFPPYATASAIRDTLGLRSSVAEDLAPGTSEGETELVFVRGDDVVAAWRYPRGKVDFSCIEPYRGFAARDARFTLRRAPGYPSLLARFARAPSPPNRAGDGCRS